MEPKVYKLTIDSKVHDEARLLALQRAGRAVPATSPTRRASSRTRRWMRLRMSFGRAIPSGMRTALRSLRRRAWTGQSSRRPKTPAHGATNAARGLKVDARDTGPERTDRWGFRGLQGERSS